MTMTGARWLDERAFRHEAASLAATAIVAAKVYEAFGWVRWSGHDCYDRDDYHVPDADELLTVLTELAARARTADPQDSPQADRLVGHLRFLASADEDGVVTFHLRIGSTFHADEPAVESA